MPLMGGVGLGYALPFSGGSNWLERFGRSAASQLDPRNLLERGYNPLVDPLAPGGADRSEEQARMFRELLMQTLQGNPEAMGAMAAGIPFRGRLPKGMEGQLLRAADKQKKWAAFLGPTRGEFGQGDPYDFSQHGVPIEAYTRPPRVEEFMAPGEVSNRVAVNRDIWMDPSGHEPRGHYAASAEDALDRMQTALNARWELQRNMSLGNFRSSEMQRRFRPYSIPIKAETALRAHFARHARRHQLPER